MTKGFDKRLRYSYIYCLKERDICLLSETSLSTQTQVFATFDLWPLVLISRSHLAIAFSIVFTYILLSGRRKGKDFQHFHHLPWFVFCLSYLFCFHFCVAHHNQQTLNPPTSRRTAAFLCSSTAGLLSTHQYPLLSLSSQPWRSPVAFSCCF